MCRSKLPFYIWLVSAILLTFLVAFISAAWLTKHSLMNDQRLSPRQKEWVIEIASFPYLVKTALLEVSHYNPQIVETSSIEKPHWVRHFPEQSDPGYLLLSAMTNKAPYPIVQLIRIADGVVMAIWQPDFELINGLHTPTKWAATAASHTLRLFHPLLLENGDLIFNTGSGLSRVSACTSKMVWYLDKVAHHSNELSSDGLSVWTPGVATNSFPDNPYLNENVRDDSLMRVDIANGTVLENLSFAKILIDNNLSHLLFGSAGSVFESDPIHLNQISVAGSDGEFWRKDDLLVSARHLSTVFIYRPSTNKIIWYQSGPWLNQHSARFVDDETISVFDNHVVGGIKDFLSSGEHNRVWLYNMRTGMVSEPWADLLDEVKPKTIAEGRAQVLNDGGLFVEETNNIRHLRLSKNKLLWSRINDIDKNYMGVVSWSRYLYAHEVAGPLRYLSKCGAESTVAVIKH